MHPEDQEIGKIYCDRSKNGENAKEAPRFLSKLAGAEAAKLKKFSDAGGAKSGGCPTPADSHFLDGSSIAAIETMKWYGWGSPVGLTIFFLGASTLIVAIRYAICG